MTAANFRAEAERALREGRVDDGITAYLGLLARSPGDGDGWYNLGYLLRCARRYDEALDAYGRALEAGAAGAEGIRLNRAVILSEFLGRDRDAESELRAALEVDGRFLPAWLNLGNLLEDRGDAAGAAEAYRRALAIDPGNGRALARLATVDVFGGRAAAAVSRLAPLVAGGRLPLADAAEASFALGAALDALARYDEAWGAYATANRAAQAAAGPKGRYDRVGWTHLVDALAASPATPVATERTAGPAPVFICGMFRSGSTLIEQILSRHSRVSAGGELEIIPALASTRLQPYPAALAGLGVETLDGLRDLYLDEVRSLHPSADMLTDKRPDNFLHLGLIKRLFPSARIVHTVRAPLDNLLSIWFLHFDDSISYGHRIEDIVHWFGLYRRLMATWRTRFGHDIHDISYEKVVGDPRETIGTMLRLLDLDWEDAVLHPEHATNLVRTASVWQVRQPLHGRSAGRWRHYERHLGSAIAAWGQGATPP